MSTHSSAPSQDDLANLLARLEQLNDIGAALSKERELARLLELILRAAKSITHADGGTLYRLVDGQALRFEILFNDTLNLNLGGLEGQPITFDDLPLFLEDGQPNNTMVAASAALTRQTVNIADAYATSEFDFAGTRSFDASTGYRSQSFLTVPMFNHEDEVVGVLQLINARDVGSPTVRAFSLADQSLAESLASQAAIAWTNRQLIDQLEALFVSFIRLINTAIDDKSPYTGGHCQRVPTLTMALAHAVNATSSGPLADFHLSEHELYALHIAGLLHDCGKVTTPVHVVDKATKLQTLFDRIALLDTRFEVLKRDAQIAALQARIELPPEAGDAARQAIEAQLQQRWQQLDADRDFLRQVNRGAESMKPQDLARVLSIAQTLQWTGPDGQSQPFLTADELENLSIKAGTLTGPERQVINRHIDLTIHMLEQLPWPKHLQRVTEYAGGHHERMDGKGYPKGLTREQMSWPARMMGIADIFEALTASDRPYKQGMRLSQAMGILYKFKCKGHIDPDLFDVFVEQKVYQAYAQQFLKPEQIDEVNPEDWLGTPVGKGFS
jgi:HD-GYP domain-containing protein (c-di-GMP phosphodiesterase class II)